MKIPALRAVFAKIPDHRSSQGRQYALDVILSMVCLALLSGETSVRGIGAWIKEQRWALKRAFQLRGASVPSHETVRLALGGLNIEALEAELSVWARDLVRQHELDDWPGMALDGKTLRGSKNETRDALQVVSAFMHDLEVVMGQTAVAEGTNEIPTARDLMHQIVLDGYLITLDAAHTQRETAEVIVAKGGPT